MSVFHGKAEGNEPIKERCGLKGKRETHVAQVKRSNDFTESSQECQLLLRSKVHRNRFRDEDFTGGVKREPFR